MLKKLVPETDTRNLQQKLAQKFDAILWQLTLHGSCHMQAPTGIVLE